ncbi:LytR/AlgR family response regulator transcription factor [Puia dinghuensis]|uniref:DNA-binding response regulator n=1 Tax=Puia dinghuensis TaxID=1792502 RepID=A0A8J2U8T9_9BACT|nr:LytTR family DNA-binding domain-containing protein [Puia dinghuensis]GGA86252.1 DNA-binding response regulator [Puia dinghuensis]
MIRTVLIDDEIDSIRVLQRLLETYCKQVSIVGTANGVESARTLIRECKPDLVLLDIEMSQGNAFDLLNQLQPLDFQVIFVTAFDNYAVRAFKYSAVDYLLKPVDIDDLRNAIDRVQEKPMSQDLAQQMKILLENVGMLQLSQQKMAIPTITGLTFVPVQDILRFEAKGNYTTINLCNGESIVATRTIKDYEDVLPEAIFCRIHNSHIINLARIQKYQKGRGGSVVMEDGSVIEVASRRREEFLRRLLK